MTNTASTESTLHEAPSAALEPTKPDGGVESPRGPKPGKARKPADRPNVIGGALGWIWLGIIILPIYYIVITSFRTSEDLRANNQLIPSSEPTIAPFIRVIENDFFQFFRSEERRGGTQCRETQTIQ